MNTPAYQTINGIITTSDDPQRSLWYANCGYWTDDWTKLKSLSVGIPICPICSCPGFVIVAQEWFEGAKRFELENPHFARYTEFLEKTKERCFKGVTLEQHFGKWLAEQDFAAIKDKIVKANEAVEALDVRKNVRERGGLMEMILNIHTTNTGSQERPDDQQENDRQILRKYLDVWEPSKVEMYRPFEDGLRALAELVLKEEQWYE